MTSIEGLYPHAKREVVERIEKIEMVEV